MLSCPHVLIESVFSYRVERSSATAFECLRRALKTSLCAWAQSSYMWVSLRALARIVSHEQRSVPRRHYLRSKSKKKRVSGSAHGCRMLLRCKSDVARVPTSLVNKYPCGKAIAWMLTACLLRRASRFAKSLHRFWVEK